MLGSAMETFESWPLWGKVACVGGAVVATAVPLYWVSRTRTRKSPYKDDWKQGIVYLYQYTRFKTIPSASPYCLKLETWLRMADIRYENVDIPITLRSREGLLPFVELNGKEYPDSGLIIRDLSVILGKEGMEAHLNDEQKASSRAFEKMVEKSTVWSYAYIRYVEKFDEFVAQFPPMAGLEKIFFWMIKSQIVKKMIATLQSVGVGRHPREEIINVGLDDMRAISKYLGNKHYFLGYKPTKVDAAIFGLLAQIYYLPLDSPHKDLMENECTNLKEFCDRIKGRFWPDWNECTEKLSLHTQWKRNI